MFESCVSRLVSMRDVQHLCGMFQSMLQKPPFREPAAADAVPILLSDRLSQPQAYRKAQNARREELFSHMLLPTSSHRARRMADLLCLIFEESRWSDSAQDFPMEDGAHPQIDDAAAQTACLVAWACALHREEMLNISPVIELRALYELRRRIFLPAQAHDDYAFFGAADDAFGVMAAVCTAALLMETDSARLSAVLKKLLPAMDRAASMLERRALPVSTLVSQACATGDFAGIVYHITRGNVNLTGEFPSTLLLDDIFSSHIYKNIFNDPAGSGMFPPICGADLFRLGAYASDDAVCALGAQLHRLDPMQPHDINARLFSARYAQQLSMTLSPVPRLRQGQSNAQAFARGQNGLYAALCAAGTPGSIVAGYAGQIILAHPDCGTQSAISIGGKSGASLSACPLNCDFHVDTAVISADLAAMFDQNAGIRVCQRTLMVEGDMIRLVDSIETDRPGEVVFHFFSPILPVVRANSAILGPLCLTWEAQLSPAVEKIYENAGFEGFLYRISLTAEAATRTLYTFYIEPV